MKLKIEWVNHAKIMVLLKDMNCQFCPQGNKKKNSNKYKKQLNEILSMK